MKRTHTIALSAIMTIAVGLTGFSAFAESFTVQEDSSAMGESSGMKGHVTLTVRDADGNIKNYLQTDNVITAIGKNCLSRTLFDVQTSCATAQTGFYDVIGVSASTYPDTSTTANLNRGGISALTGDLSATSGTATESVAASGTGSAIAKIVHTFTYSPTTAQDVNSAFLADSTNTNVLAIKNFAGGQVTLNEADQLVVTWEITLG